MPTYRSVSMDMELTADLFHGPACGIMRQLYNAVSMDTELTVDLFHGHCDIIRQLYKAFPSPSHHQSHSYSTPIWASDRVYPLSWQFLLKTCLLEAPKDKTQDMSKDIEDMSESEDMS